MLFLSIFPLRYGQFKEFFLAVGNALRQF